MSDHLKLARWGVVLAALVLAFVLAFRAPEAGYRLQFGDFVYEPATPSHGDKGKPLPNNSRPAL